MSGFEIVGVISAASALLETAIKIVGRIRQAHERQRELLTVLDGYSQELTSTKDIIKLVEDEEALRTAAVTSELVKIEAIGVQLKQHLQTMEPGDKRAMRQFASRLTHGSKDEKTLGEIMGKLTHAKSDLSLRIQVAHVGLTRTNGGICAKAGDIERIDLLLQQKFGEGKGLQIAELLQNRPPSDGIVPLSEAELARLSGKEADATTSRIVVNNITEQQALQINGPIGTEGWREVVRLEIKDNKSNGESIQLNHATSLEVFKMLLGARADTLSIKSSTS